MVLFTAKDATLNQKYQYIPRITNPKYLFGDISIIAIKISRYQGNL
jgi:hypothetical protein